MKALLYCTKAKPYLYKTSFVKVEDVVKGINDRFVYETDNYERWYLSGEKRQALNGLIIAECDIDKVEEIACTRISNGVGFDAIYDTEELLANELHKKSCLDDWHLVGYLGVKDNHTVGYALHLSNVKAFDEPKELGEYYCGLYRGEQLKKAPQNMMYVSSITYHKVENCVLISIKPEWLCKILNGEKTIEVRKQILKCLKEMVVDE